MSKKVPLLGMFVAFAVILSYVESCILVLGIPGMKIGLANLAIIIVLYLEGTKEAAVCNFVRILIVGFMFGNLFSIFFALAGATLSMIVMVIMKKTNKFSIMIVSMFGGIFHNIGQILVAMAVVENLKLIYYLPVLLVAGTVTGFVIGIVAGKILPVVKKEAVRTV